MFSIIKLVLIFLLNNVFSAGSTMAFTICAQLPQNALGQNATSAGPKVLRTIYLTIHSQNRMLDAIFFIYAKVFF